MNEAEPISIEEASITLVTANSTKEESTAPEIKIKLEVPPPCAPITRPPPPCIPRVGPCAPPPGGPRP